MSSLPPTTWPWALWLRQTGAILRLELKKNFFSKRAVIVYLLALLPVLILTVLTTFTLFARDISDSARATKTYSEIYDVMILRLSIFFGCAWVFMNLFRAELVDRSLHYYFLSAVRREVVVAGKYISGLFATVVLFEFSTAASLFLLYLPRGYEASWQHIFNGPGLKHITSYLAITGLASAGYGAVFLLFGLLSRNPVYPALGFYSWEAINFLLPPILKKLSIIHYLQSLMPVPLSEGPFAIVAEPTPAWLAVPGLILLMAILLAVASLQTRRMQITYGNE